MNARGKLVRFLYLDESGIGDRDVETHTVVAGVMLHVDNQQKALQKYLLEMADDLIGPDRPYNFHFHATDLWSGKRFFSDETKWPLKKRLCVLSYLADIPKKWELPVVYSCAERARFSPKRPEQRKSRAENTKKLHAALFLSCLTCADAYMRGTYPGETALAVVEDHQDHRGLIRTAATLMSNRRLEEIIERDPNIDWSPIKEFIEEPHFVPKSGQSVLQVADICAFILARHFSGNEYIKPFVDRISENLPFGLHDQFIRPKVRSTPPLIAPEQSS